MSSEQPAAAGGKPARTQGDPLSTDDIVILPIAQEHREFLRSEMVKHWVSPLIYSIDRPIQADELPGFVAIERDPQTGLRCVGQITLDFRGSTCEVVTLSATIEGQGIATRLMRAAVEAAAGRGCRRMLLTTSNDNLRALAFYQKRGWRLVAVHRGMIDRYRERLKAIPEIGLNGIPLHDEIELEFDL